MIKLLNKPLKSFIIYAFIVLAGSIPVYYIIVDSIWISEINEHNRIVSQATKKNLASLQLSNKKLKESILLWNRLQPETRLQEAEAMKPDSTYNIYRKNRYFPGNDYDRFQGLVSYFEINDKPYSVTVETNLEETYETILAITAVTALFFIILLFGLILLNKKISAKLWQPFYNSLQKIKSFDLNSQQNIVFEKSSILEFEEMNNSLHKLIETNILVYRHQKEFTENASHELQTPLAIVQSKLNLLLQNPSVTKGQSVIIDDTHKALSRVSRINKNLLLLAKIENQQYMDKEPILLDAALTDILALLVDFAADKQLKISQNIQSGIVVEGNRILVEIMLTNLLMNAIRHNVYKTEINISLKNHQLVISNTGIAALNENKLFKRFSAASSHTPGSGLGLSIVREICNRYNWNIRYVFLNNLHTFSLSF